MSLGMTGQRGLHEVYTALHAASLKHFTSCDILQVYASNRCSIIEAIYFESAFSVNFWACISASSLIEVATFSCLESFFTSSRIHWGC